MENPEPRVETWHLVVFIIAGVLLAYFGQGMPGANVAGLGLIALGIVYLVYLGYKSYRQNTKKKRL